ncbi:hypothetical protein GOM71_18955 [Paenibacillus sp. NEAU-GSW1]|nr:hypothetical protein [Paenibacillus sp. NEAU-GSW1]
MSRFKLTHSSYWRFAAVALLIIGVDSAVVRLGAADQLLAYAVLFDFMLVIPFFYWFLVVRKSERTRKWKAVLPLPVLGGVAAWLVLPHTLKQTAWHAIWPLELLVMGVEAAIIFYEIRLLVRVIRRFRQLRAVEPNTGEAIRMAFKDVIGEGKLASLLLHDASMFYYFFFSWGARREVSQKAAAVSTTAAADADVDADADASDAVFTYHKETNQVLMAAIATKILVLESIVAHLLLAMWSPIAAWILTVSEIWLLILLWADTRAAVLQPIRMNRKHIRLRYGLRLQADLKWADIESVEYSKAGYELTAEDRKLAASASLGSPNVRIMLRRQVRVEGFLFLQREVRTIYLSADEPQRFCEAASNYKAGEIVQL